MVARLQAVSDLNISPFEAKMGQMSARVKKFTSGELARMGSMIGGAFSVYAIGRFVSETGKAADRIDNIAQATGVSAENLQALDVLFQEGGRSAGELNQILGRLKKSLDEATVNEEYAKSIAKLGISFDDVARLGPDRILERIAIKLKESKGDMEMGEAAGNLLGRSYAELQGVMDDLAVQGLDKLRESLIKTNQIMTNDAVRAADLLQKQYDKLARQAKVAGQSAAVATVQFIQYYGARAGSLYGLHGEGVDQEAVSDAVFGAPSGRLKSAKELANEEKSAAAMRATMFKRRDAAIAAANQWFAEASGKVSVGGVSAADSLSKIGGYIGGQANPQAKIAERQLKIMELQEKLQQKIAKASEDTAKYTQDVVTALEE